VSFPEADNARAGFEKGLRKRKPFFILREVCSSPPRLVKERNHNAQAARLYRCFAMVPTINSVQKFSRR
jgi:hypothetical protein